MYADKWLFGSTRLELDPGERSVFVDLIMMGSKDNGYIRANETIPYPPKQLAAFLNVTEELLLSTISKCIQYGKLTDIGPGMWRIASWDNFKLSKSYKSELESGKKPVPGVQRTESSQQRTNSSPIREENRREEKKEYCTDFVKFWSVYPRKEGKDKTYESWVKKSPPLNKCLVALEWQKCLDQWTKDNGQFIPLPATYINQGRWKDVRAGYMLVACSICGEEGSLPNGYKGTPKCKKCNLEATEALKQADTGVQTDV
jgi:hypothetical protein